MEPFQESIKMRVENLLKVFEKYKTFGAYTELKPEGDVFFNFRDWRLMFRTMPRLRKSLIIGLIAERFACLVLRRKKMEGFSSIRYTPGKKHNFYHRCIYGDLFIFEAMIFAMDFLGPDSRLFEKVKAYAQIYVDILSDEGRYIKSGDDLLYKYGYYPQNKHLVDKKHPMYRLFTDWDVNVTENDTTYVTYTVKKLMAAKIGVKSKREKEHDSMISQHIQHLIDHLKNEGRYGMGRLSYEGGTEPSDCAVLSWTMDKHSELDPGVNMNCLSYLAYLIYTGNNHQKIYYLSNRILTFFYDLTVRDKFMEPRLHLYFPIGPVFFLWYRFMLYNGLLADKQKKLFDKNGYTERINSYLKTAVSEKRIFDPDGISDFDRLLASPYMLRQGLMTKEDWTDKYKELVDSSYFEKNIFHFTHLRYPTKIICTINQIHNAAALYSEIEIIRREWHKKTFYT